MGESDPTFSGAEAAAVQTALRAALGLPPERFALPALVGMISDEIEQLRAAGHDDAAIAALVSSASGRPVAAEAVARHYAPPEVRRPPG